MKKNIQITIVIIIAAILMCFADSAWAQAISVPIKPTVKKETVKVKVLVPQNKVFDLDKAEQVPTTNIAIYKGVTYPVYATSTGKLYILLLNSKGKFYKKSISNYLIN